MRNQLCVIVAKLRVRHAERLEDVIGRVVAERLAGRAFDDHRQQRVAGVAVQEFVARREVEILLPAHEVDELRLGEEPVARPSRQCEKCEVVSQPARVMEQLAQRDRRAERRDLRHPAANPVVERQAAFLREQDNAHRRELLGQRRDVEPRRRRDRRVVLEVGHAVPLGERELSVSHDSDRAPRRRRRAVRREDGVHPSVRRVELRQPRLRTGRCVGGAKRDNQHGGGAPNQTHGGASSSAHVESFHGTRGMSSRGLKSLQAVTSRATAT